MALGADAGDLQAVLLCRAGDVEPQFVARLVAKLIGVALDGARGRSGYCGTIGASAGRNRLSLALEAEVGRVRAVHRVLAVVAEQLVAGQVMEVLDARA